MNYVRIFDVLHVLLLTLAWISFAWSTAMSPPYARMMKAALILAWAAFAWLSYSRHKAKLRERAFAALAGPPPPPTTARSTVLRIGSKGPEVLLWKSRLCALGYMSTPVDDVFDEETAAATAAYQDNLGLVGDGIAGPRTRRAAAPRPRWRL